ncbi:MAG: hypothetical protein P8Y78_00850 [Acidihalobacter sp.]
MFAPANAARQPAAAVCQDLPLMLEARVTPELYTADGPVVTSRRGLAMDCVARTEVGAY